MASQPITPEVKALVATIQPATEALKKREYDAFTPVAYRSQVNLL